MSMGRESIRSHLLRFYRSGPAAMHKLSPTVVGYISALHGGGSLVGCSDGQLLDRFVATNDDKDRTEAELAFAVLVERHGRMVWPVCRSLVCDDDDADDAFQATFLVLVTKAGSLRVRQTLAPWLHAVAYRTALNSRKRVNQASVGRACGGGPEGESRAD